MNNHDFFLKVRILINKIPDNNNCILKNPTKQRKPQTNKQKQTKNLLTTVQDSPH